MSRGEFLAFPICRFLQNRKRIQYKLQLVLQKGYHQDNAKIRRRAWEGERLSVCDPVRFRNSKGERVSWVTKWKRVAIFDNNTIVMYLRSVDFFADVLLGSSVIKGYPRRTLKGNRISRMKRVRFNLIKKKLNIGKLNDLQDEGDQSSFHPFWREFGGKFFPLSQIFTCFPSHYKRYVKKKLEIVAVPRKCLEAK